MYENRRMKPIEIFLRKGEWGRVRMDGWVKFNKDTL
jgi:hypothetical protein